MASIGLALSGCADGSEFEESSEFRDLTTGLQLHWSIEDRVGNQITDLSGNGRHGTLVGGSFVSSPDGEAISLDGVDDYVSLTHLGIRATSLYGGVSGDFTVSAKVRITNVNKINTLCYGCGPFSTMYVGTAAYPAKVMTTVFNQTTAGSLYPLSSASLVNDEWREVTLVVDGGVSAQYYLDCQADTLLSNTGVGLKDYNYSAVGQGAAADRWFGGEIDALRVWNRALSQAELAELCPEPPEPDPLAEGLKLHWTFEDRSGNQITDVSGNGYNGTLTGGGSFISSAKGEAVSLDGINDYVSFAGPRNPALYGGVNGDFTISARVRVADLAKLNTLCYGCGPFATWYTGDTAIPNRAQASFLNQSNNGLLWSATTAALSEDQWTEVTMVVDGGVSVRHYFNCGLNSTQANANFGLKDYAFSALGYGSVATRWFGGEVDDLRIWDRALPDDELALVCDCLAPIHVDIDAPDGGDGKTWATAFNTLQAGIDAGLACGSSELWVAEGSYAPSPSAAVATITAPVSIYGGFAGTETALAQRDVVAHPTVLGAVDWQARVVDIQDTTADPGTIVRLDGFTISGSDKGAIEIDGSVDDPAVLLHNLVLTNNTATRGAGILVNGSIDVEVSGCTFTGNAADYGGAIYVDEVGNGVDQIAILDSSFSSNTARAGGAIYYDGIVDGGGEQDSLLIADNDFTSNSSTAGAGGALWLDYCDDTTIVDSSFATNSATGGGGGAVWLDEGHIVIEDSNFIDNTGPYAGAIQIQAAVADVDILDSRFVSNQAIGTTGGGVRNLATNASVTNSEFVGNTSASHGGGFYGRATFTSTTFANNVASGTGNGLFAPSGPAMTIRNVAAWPDNLAAGSMVLDHSCLPTVPYSHTNVGSVFIAANPFAPADLDTDGLTEYYLAPGSACLNTGGTVGEFDWTTLTTQSSQCTDSNPVDAGIHYTPQSAVGPC
jgi:hypothetical protein